jgi:DNA polymerase III subunit gamma/tau
MSLYHKHRPQSLSAVVGNTAVTTALEGMLSNLDKCPRVFLLHGGTGCGKTTIGRIMKSMLEITDTDYREIDSADFRGIDTIRELRKHSNYMPLESPYRMFLLDECHKLTNDAQNALLKLLEDTPKHLFFILCTTEPEKIIKAVRGRCSEFQLNSLKEEEMVGLLRKTARKEGEKLDTELLETIAESAQGHPRNALQILEQVLNTEPEQREEAAKVIVEQQAQSIELCRALLGNKPWKSVAAILTKLKGQDAESIRRVVLGYAQAILLKTDNPKAGLVLECFIEPFYNSGFPGLVYACYEVISN